MSLKVEQTPHEHVKPNEHSDNPKLGAEPFKKVKKTPKKQAHTAVQMMLEGYQLFQDKHKIGYG